MASAQRETGAPVSVHAEPPGALEIQAPDVLEAGGVDPERVTIAHVDADIDPAYRAAIAARGAAAPSSSTASSAGARSPPRASTSCTATATASASPE